MIKIGFVGTSGSAKTTSLHSVAGFLKQNSKVVEIVPESARIARRRGFPINDKTTGESQLYMLTTQMSNELEAELDKPDFILTDRTVYDGLAFSNLYCPYIVPMMKSMIQDFVAFRAYDLILVYFPLPTPPEEDGVRDTSKLVQERITNEFRKIFTNYHLPFLVYFMTQKTKETRVTEAINVIKTEFIR